MKKETELYVGGLNGYLSCLSRLCGYQYSFSVNMFDAKCDIDEFVIGKFSELKKGDEYCKGTDYLYLGKSEIKFDAICEQIEHYVFNGLLGQVLQSRQNVYDSLKRTFIEDLNEYYGLISTALNHDGVFHPLIRGPVFKLDITNVEYEEIFCFLVKIENYYVLSMFSKRPNVR